MLGLLTGRAGRLVLAALAGMALVAGIYLAGVKEGRQRGAQDVLEQRARTVEQVRGIEDETRKTSDDDLVDWLTRP